MKFTSEMFPDLERASLAAMNAQYAFDKWLAEQVVVWGHEDRDFGVMTYFDDEETATEGTNTHRARLVAIEKL